MTASTTTADPELAKGALAVPGEAAALVGNVQAALAAVDEIIEAERPRPAPWPAQRG